MLNPGALYLINSTKKPQSPGVMSPAPGHGGVGRDKAVRTDPQPIPLFVVQGMAQLAGPLVNTLPS